MMFFTSLVYVLLSRGGFRVIGGETPARKVQAFLAIYGEYGALNNKVEPLHAVTLHLAAASINMG